MAVAESQFEITELPRGGKLLRWGEFVLQLGAYPETIKDTLQNGVPDLFLIPDQMFDVSQGVSSAELEFPVYYNFYMKGRRTRFICRRGQLRAIVRVLREAVFGPASLHRLHEEFTEGEATPGFPDLVREMAFFKTDPKRPRGRLMLRDLVIPIVLDDAGRAAVDGVLIEALGRNRYRLSRESETHEVLFETAPFSAPLYEPEGFYQPPPFGVTIIGSGHGFDAATSTSGFLIWINGKGVLVDPPVHSTSWLKEQHIDTRLVQDLILTHCHADHDSGTLQKVLEESRISLHTSETVMGSFVRKYRSLTGLTREQFTRLFDFRPVLMGDPVSIAGGEFRFHYTLHPIPTLGFSVTYQGRTFAYSCDTLYCPETFARLRDEGWLTQGRMDELLNFRWDADLILHEAGVPPIHTPMSVLAQMSEDVKDRMYLTHVSKANIPPDSGLRLAPTGAQATLRVDVPEPRDTNFAHRVLDLLAHLDLFSEMKINRAAEFFEIVHYEKHPAGTTIVRTGEPGERFYMVLNGELSVTKDGILRKVIGRYDYFGEIAVVLAQPRFADVVARTDVELVWISRRDFLQFVAGSDVLTTLRRVSELKMGGAWNVFQMNRLLRSLSTYQKTQLLALMRPVSFAPEAVLFEEGDRATSFYLIESGQVVISGAGEQVRLGPGAVVGQLSPDDSVPLHRQSARCATGVSAHTITSLDLSRFMSSNPGTFVRLWNASHHGRSGYVC